MVSGDSKQFELLKNLIVKDVVLQVDEMIADANVKSLMPRQRKCLYENEPDSDYFQVFVVVRW